MRLGKRRLVFSLEAAIFNSGFDRPLKLGCSSQGRGADYRNELSPSTAGP
jgi:hypothetical protein